jgi:hypothetical protein
VMRGCPRNVSKTPRSRSESASNIGGAPGPG